jgi:small subunit ribosomal protein S6
MRNYEVTFIVDPVLSGDEIKAAAKSYVKHLEKEGCKIVHIDEMGLLELAYPINKRTSGIYYCVEFEVATGALIDNLELAFRRDERIMRYLTVSLDKYGVKYNDDKRNGKIGKAKKATNAEAEKADSKPERKPARPSAKTETTVKEAPVAKAKPAVAAPVVAAPVVEEVVAAKETEPVAEETETTEAPVAEETVVAVEEKTAEVAEPEVTDEAKSEEE